MIDLKITGLYAMILFSVTIFFNTKVPHPYQRTNQDIENRKVLESKMLIAEVQLLLLTHEIDTIKKLQNTQCVKRINLPNF